MLIDDVPKSNMLMNGVYWCLDNDQSYVQVNILFFKAHKINGWW